MCVHGCDVCMCDVSVIVWGVICDMCVCMGVLGGAAQAHAVSALRLLLSLVVAFLPLCALSGQCQLKRQRPLLCVLLGVPISPASPPQVRPLLGYRLTCAFSWCTLECTHSRCDCC